MPVTVSDALVPAIVQSAGAPVPDNCTVSGLDDASLRTSNTAERTPPAVGKNRSRTMHVAADTSTASVHVSPTITKSHASAPATRTRSIANGRSPVLDTVTVCVALARSISTSPNATLTGSNPAPAGSNATRPIRSPSSSVNQRLPSGPAAIPIGPLPG